MEQKSLQRTETITQLESSVRKAKNVLERGSTIHSPFGGKVLETEVSVGAHVNSASTYFKLQDVNDQESDRGFIGIFFVGADKAKKLKKKMKVQVFPGEIDKNEFGFLVGNIESISEFPVSEQKLQNEFGDPQVARQMISKMGIPYEVRVSFTSDKSTTSGYVWSSRKGPPVLLQSGTICASSYEVGYKRPISLVMTWVRKMFKGEE
jgi:NHLM bacteriocin system secretion protein